MQGASPEPPKSSQAWVTKNYSTIAFAIANQICWTVEVSEALRANQTRLDRAQMKLPKRDRQVLVQLLHPPKRCILSCEN